MTKVLAGHRAPDFALPDLNGKSYSLSSILSRGPLVVAFFKVSCPVCHFTFPFLERLNRAYGSQGISIWGISQDDTRDTKDFCKEFGVTFPVLLDSEGYAVSNTYGLTNVPTVLLIAPTGETKVSFTGFDKAGLERIARELGGYLGKEPSPVFLPGELVPDYKPG